MSMKFSVLFVVAVTLIAQTPQPALSKADIESMMKELSNWGRWGKADEKGTVNLITPARRKEAAALVTEGVSISLAQHRCAKGDR